MKYLMLTLILATHQLLALEWYDLNLYDTYKLEKEIIFEKEKINLKDNEEFLLLDIITLPINVSIFMFEVKKCPGANLSTDMIIVQPSYLNSDSSVGVQLQENCLLEVFVEFKDYFTKSLFSELHKR